MKEEPFIARYISRKNCFLHFPEQWLQSFANIDEKICLKIQYGNDKSAYLSCSAQPFPAEDNHSVGINATYAHMLGIKDGEEVLLSSYTNAAPVSKVNVCLLTAEEWEIMELSMHAVQSSLLDQVRVVWPGQVLVVWISKYLHFSLRVDAIEPNYKVGILEPFTDLAVAIPDEESVTFQHPTHAQPSNPTVSSKNDTLGQEDSLREINHTPYQNNAGANQSASHDIWGSIKGLFSFGESFDTDQRPASHADNSSENIDTSSSPSSKDLLWNDFLVPYRVHPLPRLIPKTEPTNSSDVLLHHPFNVFVHRCNLPSRVASLSITTGTIICKLTQLMQSVNPKSDEKHAKHEKDEKSAEASRHEEKSLGFIYARLCIIEDIYSNCSIETKEQLKRAASYSEHRCILVPNPVYINLKLVTGSRINLSFESHAPTPISTITLIPVGKWNADKTTIETVFRMYLYNLIMGTGLFLNSNTIINLQVMSIDYGEVFIQLAPLALSHAVLDAETLSRCDIVVSEGNTPNREQIVPDHTIDNAETSKMYFGSGMRRLINEGLTTLEMSLCLEPSFNMQKKSKFCLASNTLILGKLGSGKTTLAHHLCTLLEAPPYFVHCITVECKPLKGKKVETLHKLLMLWVAKCISHQPSVLFFDDFDAIAGTPTSEEHTAEETYFFRIGDMLANILEEVQHQNYLVVLATAPSISKLSPAVAAARGQHFFKTILDIPELSKHDRLETMKAIILQKTNISPNYLATLDLSGHAAKAEGYVVQDISDLVDKAIFEGWKRTLSESKDVQKGMVLKARDIAEAMSKSIPLSLRGVTLHKDSTHTWSDVGGLTEVKRELIEVLQWPSQYMDLFAKCPLRHQSGLLLYGAPGTGKTLLAAAVSHECGLNFISVKGPELLSKYIGASEEAVRNIFQKAQSARPCVLFFDEFDSLAPRRGHDSTGVTDRVVNQLLTQLDGVESLTGVWVVAATSRPDLLDPALLRPGRLDKTVLCPLPNAADRADILRSLSRKLHLASDVDLEVISSRSEGFTGADLQAVLYTAQLMSVEEQQKLVPDFSRSFEASVTASPSTSAPITPSLPGSSALGEVTQAHLLAALADTRPSLPPDEKRRYQIIYNKFIGARRGKSRELEVVSQRATLA